MAASYLVILFSKYLSLKSFFSVKLLKFFGKNTLLILCIHDFELKVLSWHWIDVLGYKIGLSDFLIKNVLILAKITFCVMGVLAIKGIKKIYLNKLLIKIRRFKKRREKYEKAFDLNTESKRIQYWDIAKGITIIACVLGHCAIPDFLRMVIFSFHMPLFFISNGYFVKSYDINRTFHRSVKTLLVPYIVTCFLSAIIYTFTAKTGETALKAFLFKILVMIGGKSKTSTRFGNLGSVWLVWFVCCLFIARNLYVFLMKITERYSKQARMIIVVAVSSAGYLIGKYYAFMPWSLDVAMVSLIFVAFGDWMRKTKFMDKNYFYTLILPCCVWIYFLQMGIHIELATRHYPYGIMSILEAIAGSLVIISCSKILEKEKFISRVLAWCGRNSMIILILHCLEMMYFDWETVVYSRLPFSMNWFRIFIIKMAVILIITYFYNCVKQTIISKIRA